MILKVWRPLVSWPLNDEVLQDSELGIFLSLYSPRWSCLILVLMTPKCIHLAQMSAFCILFQISRFPLDIFTWMSNRYLRLNIQIRILGCHNPHTFHKWHLVQATPVLSQKLLLNICMISKPENSTMNQTEKSAVMQLTFLGYGRGIQQKI